MIKLWFMFKKFLTDLRRFIEKGHEIPEDVHSQVLGPYYFKFVEARVASGKDQKLIAKFDQNGIPINATYIDVDNKDYVYFPITIGQLGLAVYHTYLVTKSEYDKGRFLKFVEWFIENAIVTEELGAIWYTDVDLPAYGRKAPWQSAFSQSRAISILLRGYQLTGNERMKLLAEQALIPFTKLVDEGGVTSHTENGPFYEEYPASVPTLVLNGKIFALWGIYDYLRVFPGDKLCYGLWENGLKTLVNSIKLFDLGYWSRYNLCKAPFYPSIDPSTIGYQKLHIQQLYVMYRITGHKIFKEYTTIFSRQIGIVNIIKMYKKKYEALKRINRI